jgi:diguanylate cyclase (GGDEF)-like protein/PAS domain S-box-containing protein
MSTRQSQLRRVFMGSLGLFLVSILALSAYSLWRSRADAIADGLHVAALHSRSLENFLTQSLGVVEQVAANVAPQEASGPDLKRLQDSLVVTLRNTPSLRSLSLQDETGRIVASSNPANVGLTVSTDRFLPPAKSTQEILRLGQPWSGRDFAGGHASAPDRPVPADATGFVPATRALTATPGRLTLLLALNPDYFVNQMFQAVDAVDGRVEVLLYDGTLLMGSAADARPGASYAALLAGLHLGTAESGSFEQAADGVAAASLSAYRASRTYPFVVLTRLDRDHILLAWWADAQTLAAVLSPMLLAFALLATAFYRRQMEMLAQRAEAERLLRINATVFDASSEAIVVTDADANIISVNAAFTRITGYSEAEVKGSNPRLLSSGLQDKAFYVGMWQELLAAGVWRGELTNRRKNASPFEAGVSISISRDGEGRIQHFIGVIADITERKRVESKVLELNRDFVSFLDNSRDFIYFKDKDSRFRFASQALASITGHAHWRDMTGKHDLEVFPPETARIYQEEELPIFRNGRPLLNKVDPYFDADGNKGWVNTSKWPLLDVLGNVEGLFGISRDITAQKLSEERLQLAASVFHNSREGITITATDGTIVDVNEAFTDITGYNREEVIGQNPRILSSGRHNQEHYTDMWQSLLQKGHWYGEIWNRRKSGEIYAEMLTISTVRDALGQPQNYVALFSDITTAKVHKEHLEHIAHYDALTGLPNRVLLADRLKQAMLQVQRRAQRLAVVYLDLDGFKMVNDAHGHEAGDQLLIALAGRMKGALREGDTLARIGGDEFVAVLVDLADATESMPMLNRLLLAASEPVVCEGQSLRVSASLGVTLYPQDGDMDADQLHRQADQAMYQAKVSGKNRYHFFDATHDRHVREHHESLAHIRRAISGAEFVLHYQPKVHMRSGRIVGAEALIRWQHPQRGLLEPALFLSVIEDNVLAVELDVWVLGTALGQMQAWQDAGMHMPVSINVGARLLQQHDFVQRLHAILRAHPGVDPAHVQLEVLETSALEDIGHVSRTMDECRQLGVTFALDDFGTGYSSLTYVKRLPVSLLKIDKSFVRDMLTDRDDMAILRAVTSLATAFQQDVIAEGVETLEHGLALMDLGCELAQGYFIARAMPAQDFVDWARTWQCDPAWLHRSAGVSATAQE